MAFFTPSFQASITPPGGGAINSGNPNDFSVTWQGSPRWDPNSNPLANYQVPPNSFPEGYNFGASLIQSNGAPQGGVYSQQSFGGTTPNGSFNYGAQPINMSNLPKPPSSPMGPFPQQTAGQTVPSGGFGQSGWNPGFQQNLGAYNPSQYADMNTSNQLAQSLGGNVLQTRIPTGPFNVPAQNTIDFGGEGKLNAGLLAERYAKYDKATADAMTQAELAGLSNSVSGNLGDDLGYMSQFSNIQGGGQYGGQGQNMGQFLRQPGSTPSLSAPNAPQQYWSGGAPGGGNSPGTVNPPLIPGISSPQTPGAAGYVHQNLVPGMSGPQPVFGTMPGRAGGFGRFSNFSAANPMSQAALLGLLQTGVNTGFRNRPGNASNSALLSGLLGRPSLLGYLNPVSAYGGGGGSFGFGFNPFLGG